MNVVSSLHILVLIAFVQSNLAFGNGPATTKTTTSHHQHKAPNDLLTNHSVSLPLTLQQGVKVVDQAATNAATSAELLSAWELGLQTATAITGATKKAALRSFGENEQEIEAINQAIPWGYLTFYGEGQHPKLELKLKYWTALAKKLPDPEAMAFFKLAELSYGNASFYGWSNIQYRTWDYGGCSPLGTGLHLNILTQIDAINQSPSFASQVADTVRRIRDHVMTDLLQGTAEFPYCKRDEPDRVANMLEEGRAIMSQVALSAEEQQALQQRVDTNMGLSVKQKP